MADTESAKNNKRRLRAPSQTVREQAEKAQAEAAKTPRTRRLKAAAATTKKPLGFVGRLFNRQPFKFIGRILVPKFVRNAFVELKLVTWPNRKQTRQLTFAVLAFAIVFGVVITVVDYGLDKLFKTLILK